MTRIGVISDTHGLLRPQALAFLEGSDAIVHSGDIGSAAILDALRAIAPLTVVRGNNDRVDWAVGIPDVADCRVDGDRIRVIHDLTQLDAGQIPADVRVVVSGHTHQPHVAMRDGVLYVNPGSAGPRRFRLPISVGELRHDGGAWTARIVDLDPSAGA